MGKTKRMSTVTSSREYIPVADYYSVEQPYVVVPPPNITQTYVSPYPRVKEVQVNELLPFQAAPNYTINNWVVRSNVADRGALANSMLLVWRPEDLDYGSDVDTTSVPQVYLFTNDKERLHLQRRLYTDYPELNLQSYALKVPVRIGTHRYPGASLVARESVVLPGPYGATVPSAVVVPEQPATYEPLTYPPELYEGITNVSPATPIGALPPLIGPGPKRLPSKRKSRSSKRASAKSKK